MCTSSSRRASAAMGARRSRQAALATIAASGGVSRPTYWRGEVRGARKMPIRRLRPATGRSTLRIGLSGPLFPRLDFNQPAPATVRVSAALPTAASAPGTHASWVGAARDHYPGRRLGRGLINWCCGWRCPLTGPLRSTVRNSAYYRF